jgi:hypothetical protein
VRLTGERAQNSEPAAPVPSLHGWFEAALRAADPEAVVPSSLAEKEAMAEVLHLARTSEQGVCAPASPLSAFILGVAVGCRHGGLEELRGTIERITTSANGWRGEHLVVQSRNRA